MYVEACMWKNVCRGMYVEGCMWKNVCRGMYVEGCMWRDVTDPSQCMVVQFSVWCGGMSLSQDASLTKEEHPYIHPPPPQKKKGSVRGMRREMEDQHIAERPLMLEEVN